MEQVVYFAGWVFLTCIALVAVLSLAVLVLRFWPIRITWATASRKLLNARQGVPRMDWRRSGAFNPVNAFLGLSSRGKTRWFFGLVLFGPDGNDAGVSVVDKPAKGNARHV